MRVFFFFRAVLCNHLSSLSLSLSTSIALIGPHPLTQDSLLFWSSIISCNVLNLESPSKSSASLQLCLFLYFHISFGLYRLQITLGFNHQTLRIFLMEINPLPQSVEAVLWCLNWGFYFLKLHCCCTVGISSMVYQYIQVAHYKWWAQSYHLLLLSFPKTRVRYTYSSENECIKI